MLSLLLLFAATDPTVTLEVAQGGDVKWQGSCVAEVFAKDADTSTTTVSDAAQPFSLASGAWDVVVACPSDEGVVKKTVPLVVKDDDVTARVAFAPGFLLVNVVRFDTPVSAEVTVLDERGREVAHGKERAVMPVEPGRLRVVAKLDDGGRHVLGNAAASVTTKKRTDVTVDTTDGELVVLLTDNGKKAGGVAALRQPGQKTRLVELRAGEKGQAPPGSYDLVTQLEDAHDFGEVVTRGVTISPGKTTSKTVAHRTGAARPRVLVDGKAVTDKVEIDLYAPGAATPFNTVAAGEVLKLQPGKVRLVARLLDRTLDDGTSLSGEATVAVPTGGATAPTIELGAARLDVVTTVGKKPQPLEVSLVPFGAEAAAVTRRTGADGASSFSVSAGTYHVVAALSAPQGEVTTRKQLVLRTGARLGLRLDLDIGTAVVQVFEAGVAVPAEVRFYTELKGASPTASRFWRCRPAPTLCCRQASMRWPSSATARSACSPRCASPPVAPSSAPSI
ncbi:MAG: hypothetical protein A2138_23400 [Deltaproteobacteria bacterium RBG_16_71_12]|nr:MAG: hypothetical protein A2138_23400 [Deltaproteobacteria bacterium RBG_16_71_12]